MHRLFHNLKLWYRHCWYLRIREMLFKGLFFKILLLQFFFVKNRRLNFVSGHVLSPVTLS